MWPQEIRKKMLHHKQWRYHIQSSKLKLSNFPRPINQIELQRLLGISSWGAHTTAFRHYWNHLMHWNEKVLISAIFGMRKFFRRIDDSCRPSEETSDDYWMCFDSSERRIIANALASHLNNSVLFYPIHSTSPFAQGPNGPHWEHLFQMLATGAALQPPIPTQMFIPGGPASRRTDEISQRDEN